MMSSTSCFSAAPSGEAQVNAVDAVQGHAHLLAVLADEAVELWALAAVDHDDCASEGLRLVDS